MNLGLDASSSTCGFAISNNGKILEAGFIDIKKIATNKEKAYHIISKIESSKYFKDITKINLESALSGFANGFTSQKTIIMLSRFNAILEYILSEKWNISINLCNVNTMRKKVFGKCRIKGVKPKIFVELQLNSLMDISGFTILNKKGNPDARMPDVRDAIICSLF